MISPLFCLRFIIFEFYLQMKPLQADTIIKQAKTLIGRAQFESAKGVLAPLLDDVEEHIEALYCLAVCERKLSQYTEALLTLDRLHTISRQYSPGHQERGYNYLALGQFPEAINAFETAVERNPALHGSWRALLGIEGYQGADLAKQHLDWLTSLPAELVSVASYTHQGMLIKAERLCRQFLKKQTNHPEGMRLLAQLAVKFHILDDAEFLLESCVENHPNFLQARLDYVEVLHRRQKFPQMLEQAKQLVALDSSNPGFLISLANAQQAMGDYKSAIKMYKRVLDSNINSHSVHLALGHSLKTAGRADESIEAYQAAYQTKPDFGDAYWSLANLKTYRFSDIEIRAMRELERAEFIADDDRAHLCFALGKAYEDQQLFEQSFDYYRQGNLLKSMNSNYELTHVNRELDWQKTHFNTAFFKQRSGYGESRSDPIFIVGLPRAGSTLLEQVLASHSLVDGTMELANILSLAQKFNGRQSRQSDPRYPAILSQLNAEQCRTLGKRYLDDTQAHRGAAPRFIDKMPNNFRHIGLIHLILPNAKIIDARREPMACCFSGYKQLFAEGQEFSYGLTDIGEYYLEYIGVMEHWDTVLPGKILRVQHEDVIADLEGQVRRILNYCDLEFEQNCIDFHKNTRAVRTPSAEQVRQPIYKTGMDQWKNYEQFLGPLRSVLRGTNG